MMEGDPRNRLPMTNDEDFEPELLRMRDSGSPKGRNYLPRVTAEAGCAGSPGPRSARPFSGSRIGRGAAAGRLLASRGLAARRAMVKASYVRLSGRDAARARAHLSYIARDGASRDGAPARLYSAGKDEADGKAFLERSDGDRHQFRFIVSAEDGFEYGDLKPLIRRVMEKVEDDLGTRLDWVAADHHDTAHPHTHILVRGRDGNGKSLVIARDYLARGLRARVAEQVSLDLGPPTVREVSDRIMREAGVERAIALHRGVTAVFQQRELLEAAAQLSAEFGVPMRKAEPGEHLSGALERRLELASGRFALLERPGELVLVPWRPGMEELLGRSISGRAGPGGFSWSSGKSLGIG
jgi:hypothetical protein